MPPWREMWEGVSSTQVRQTGRTERELESQRVMRCEELRKRKGSLLGENNTTQHNTTQRRKRKKEGGEEKKKKNTQKPAMNSQHTRACNFSNRNAKRQKTSGVNRPEIKTINADVINY